VTSSNIAPKTHTYDALKAKNREIRADFPEALRVRVHRALSWLGRAEKEEGDDDVRFILLWIGFNAAYAGDLRVELADERGAIRGYFDALVQLDQGHRIYNAVWMRFPHEIRQLLGNKHVYGPFWHHHNGVDGYGDWEDRMAKAQRSANAAIVKQDTSALLQLVFDRLYVLRNQLVHGGATWRGGVNRDQVRDGAAVLGFFLPVFIDIMMDNPIRDWGPPFYPVVDDSAKRG
jgi:hypothetical protein